MQKLLQILKINELKSGVSAKTGKPYEMQDAECMLLNDETGEVESVGVLKLSKGMRGQSAPKPGIYRGVFDLAPDLASRTIGAVLRGLEPAVLPSPAPKGKS